MYKFKGCTLSKISNYKYITNFAIVIILITTTIGIFNQFKNLEVQLAYSELSLSSLNNIKKINNIIKSLQKERGLSTIYSIQNNQKNLNALLSQRQHTSIDIDPTKLSMHSNILLKDVRTDILKKMDSLQYTQEDVFNNYTSLIQNLLHLQYKQILNIKNDYIKNKLFFNRDIKMIQESLGQLRAKVGTVIASRNTTKSNLLKIRSLQALLHDNIYNLKLYDEYILKYKQINKFMNSSTVLQTLDIINTIVSTSSVNKITLDASQWFNLSTDAINKLIEFTAINLDTIYEDIIKVKQDANSYFMLHIILWLSGFIGIIILFVTSYKRNSELKIQHDMLVDYKKAVDYRTIISKTDPKGIITYANEEFCKVSGYSHDELINKNHNIVRHEDMPTEAFKEMWKTIKQGKPWEGRVKNRKKDGSFYWVDATINAIFDDDGNLKEYIGLRHDITDIVLLNEELIEAQSRLKEQTIRDPLTNLYNRRHLQDISQNLINISKREKTPLSILMLDIDKFKNINDTYGHSVGDDVIIQLALLLKNNTRESDVIARIGGEEFVILLPNTDKDGAFTIGHSLRELVEKETIIIDKNTNIHFTISLGVESVDNEYDFNIDEPLQRADKALYRAKESGRNRVVIF